LWSISGKHRTEFHRLRIDTEGGYNTAVFSACTSTTTNRVFDLKATDTYAQSGDQVFIEADSFVQVVNPATCTATNEHAVPFRVAGGTGGHAGATGQGHFNITSNLTPCNGLTVPAQVTFQGVLIRRSKLDPKAREHSYSRGLILSYAR
jgi:hypothetical protein